ncbi:arginine:ornithine antiporter/lysine permease [Peribacillus deserti]|uniref:Arginine-ornithine antiporter n=1 Tax=Peribacillus deserti TaxID=673318 RepID=A0ABS2QDW0_9BACI|nr:arginine-ornithine antiporter [Peribacillus deserti]MBM7691215.1 arginine:ornithine antiporter/lysine permease [Peribacillus deserti]
MEEPSLKSESKLGQWPLIALVIGSVIGGGAFNLPSDIAQGANTGAILIGWLITGIGILALGLSFQNLNNKRPELKGGIFAYARAGFGQFMGFNSAWGYWCSAFLGNVAFATLFISALSYFFPVFNGRNIASIIGASIILWVVHFLVLRGVKSASLVNTATTIAKLIPILMFVILGILAFQVDIFTADFWGTASFSLKSLQNQVKSTMLITLWVFVGFEGAVVLSGRAKNHRDVGRATVIGLLCTLTIYILISVISAGIMKQEELAGLNNPSLAYVLEHAVGEWGAALVNIGLIISVLGAWLGWTILAAEIPYIAGKEKVFPSFFSKENKNLSPSRSLFLSNLLIQLFLLTFLVSEKPYQLAYSLASSAILIPYLFAAFYQIKYSFHDQSPDKTRNLVIGSIAAIYSIWLIYAAGLSYLLLTLLLYLPGIAVYIAAQTQYKKQIFSRNEGMVAAVIVVMAITALVMLYLGKISV